MGYGIAADTVVAIHLAWILFIIGGAAIGWKIVWVKWLHIVSLAFSVFLQVFSWICPLTHLEVWLRSRDPAGEVYSGTFIRHYLEKLVYMEVPQGLILGLTFVIIGVSGYIYLRPLIKSRLRGG